MSLNCIRCIKNERTGFDLLCNKCRAELLKCTFISRVADNDKCLLLSFNRMPTDDEMRDIQDKFTI
jgi:hypothetical protein